ncbi:hypothetical protein Q767_03070 [Flavobacterium enshiense DK69]|uniref:Beta-lactamase-related domain-containing protein n=1 Tax=Flavobacterium enshiense DK69 TaxID=1107311 RepID=A0A0A2MWL1_9FLAO|nr:hypothetical protein Q767_03070 [Flavobacterium enshiense DK69]
MLLSTRFYGQNPEHKIDSVITAQFNEGKFNGNIEVIKNNAVIYRNSLGYSDFTSAKKLNKNSVFYLGSLSKQFTAMCIMILKSKGKLQYDDPVIKYLPDFPFKTVTIRHLLTHSSGMNDYITLNEEQWKKYPNATDKDVVRMLKEDFDTLRFQPGESFFYSNTNYSILVNIIEKVSKKSYPEFIHSSVFKRLGMGHSFIKTEKNAYKKGVKGYIKNDSQNRYELPDSLNGLFDSPTAKIIGGGGVFSTLDDLYKWDKALYSNKLLPKTILEEAFMPYTFSNGTKGRYGFGWNVYHRDNGDIVVRHAGQFTGYLSVITRNITRKETIIILTNVTGNNDTSNFITLMTNIETILETSEKLKS